MRAYSPRTKKGAGYKKARERRAEEAKNMNELATQIANVCRGHKTQEVCRALDFVRAWVLEEAIVPFESIKNPALDMTTGRKVEAMPTSGSDVLTGVPRP